MARKKMKFWVALAVILGVMGTLIYYTTVNTQVYYLKPSELIAKVKKDRSIYSDRVRVGGLVIEDNIKGANTGRRWSFYVTDERGDYQNELIMIALKESKPSETIKVDYRGVVPDTFRAGGIAIVEGTYGKDGIFRADVLLAKCPSKYVGKSRPGIDDKIPGVKKKI